MGTRIDRKGTGKAARYRLWTTEQDRYLTDPLTRKAMHSMLVRRDTLAAVEAMKQIPRDVEERMKRADGENATSGRIDKRSAADEWAPELCDTCRGFHHAFKRRADGKCGHCGEPEGEPSHSCVGPVHREENEAGGKNSKPAA